jgi:hypothetical protein
MSQIFISYAREDRERIQPLAECLERHGWTVFWDRNIQTGQNWHSVISTALDRAERVIVAWSKDSLASDFVRDEAAAAQERRALVPILLDHVMPPLGFRQIQAADFTDWHGEEDSAALAQLLRDLVPPLRDPSLPAAYLSTPAVAGPVARPTRRRIPLLAVATGLVGLIIGGVALRLAGQGNDGGGSSTPSGGTSSVPLQTAAPTSTGVDTPPRRSAEPSEVPPGTYKAEREKMLEALRAYYRDVNAGSFRAERYFAPRVKVYIGMLDTSAAALDDYFKNVHPRLYREYEVTMEEGTVARTNRRVLRFNEVSNFIETKSGRRRHMVAANVVSFNEEFKMVSFATTRISG